MNQNYLLTQIKSMIFNVFIASMLSCCKKNTIKYVNIGINGPRFQPLTLQSVLFPLLKVICSDSQVQLQLLVFPWLLTVQHSAILCGCGCITHRTSVRFRRIVLHITVVHIYGDLSEIPYEKNGRNRTSSATNKSIRGVQFSY